MQPSGCHPVVRVVLLCPFIAAMLGGCVSVYQPNAVQTPLFTNGGEVHAAAHISLNSVDLQGACSPISSIAILGGFGYNADLLTTSNERHLLGEFALGYYMPGGSNLRLELFVGAGFGRSRDITEDAVDLVYRYDANYRRYFVQGNIGSSGTFSTSTGRQWKREGGIAVRFAYLHFSDLRGNETPVVAPDVLFFEPVLFGRVGTREVMLEGQLGFSQPSPNPSFDWQEVRGTIGMHVVLGRGG